MPFGKYLNGHERECTCTDPAHGGKLWLCGSDKCYRDRPEEDDEEEKEEE